MVISILVGLYMFVNGILIGWGWEEIKYEQDKVSTIIILSLAGSLGLVLYGIGILITKLWELIKSL